jgi:MipA family protein
MHSSPSIERPKRWAQSNDNIYSKIVETGRTRRSKLSRDISKPLLYADPTIDFSVGDLFRMKSLRETYLGVSVSHRSDIFGTSKLFNNVDDGSNYIYGFIEQRSDREHDQLSR